MDGFENIHPDVTRVLKSHNYTLAKGGGLESPNGVFLGDFCALTEDTINRWTFGDGCRCGAINSLAITLGEIFTSSGISFATSAGGDKPYFEMHSLDGLAMLFDIVSCVEEYATDCENGYVDMDKPADRISQIDKVIVALERAKTAIAAANA